MSIDTSGNPSFSSSDVRASNGRMLSDEQWRTLLHSIASRSGESLVTTTLGPATRDGQIYRWGWAASGIGNESPLDLLSRLATSDGELEGKVKKLAQSIDLQDSADTFLNQLNHRASMTCGDAAEAVTWAAALPALVTLIERETWSDLLRGLVGLHEAILQRDMPSSATHLILGGELGLTLQWLLPDLRPCKKLRSAAIDAVIGWCERGEESVSAAIAHPTDARLVMASMIRCQRFIQSHGQRKLRKRHRRTGTSLATWVIAMTTDTGGTAFSQARREDVRDDLGPGGLLAHAAELDPGTLQPAMEAALGQSHSGGRLAWQVGLPEAIHHDADAKISILLPDWDVRRGRTHVDYSQAEVRIESFAGRRQVIAGNWQTSIDVDGQEQQPNGDWTEVCEYSDDDVHYIEIEQRWTGGLLVQRQILVLRDDRCVLLADAVLPERGDDQPSKKIRYTSRLPLSPKIETEPEHETREIYLRDKKRRGLVIPLSASEWRVGPTDATLKETEDRHLLLTASGKGRLYAPLWFDFQGRRHRRKRTWRQLTVAENLRINAPHEAVGYRVQMGSEHWAVYRSLAGEACRSMLGKHIVAEFYCSHFEPSDGSHDDLVTVDDNEPENA